MSGLVHRPLVDLLVRPLVGVVMRRELPVLEYVKAGLVTVVVLLGSIYLASRWFL